MDEKPCWIGTWREKKKKWKKNPQVVNKVQSIGNVGLLHTEDGKIHFLK